MDRDLPLAPTLIFIGSLILVIALYMQVSPKLHRPPVSQFFDGGANGLLVLFKNRLVSVESESLDVVFSDYGVSQHVGEIMLLAGGDRVLNTAGQSTSLLHKWRRFNRKTEFRAKGGSSLLRCDSQFSECSSWGDDALHFDTPWSGLSVSNDHHLILDTARHQIYLLNANGDLLDTLKGFKFPNQASLSGDDVWVVDTNRNSLAPLKIDNNQLFRVGEPLYLTDFSGISHQHRFPSMAYKVADAWIVLTHANGMDDGKVYRLNDGKATQLFEHQKDISSLYFSDGNLFVAAFSDHTLWSMNLKSGSVQRIQSDSFDNAVLAVDKTIRLHRLEFYLQAGVVIAIGLFALIFSLRRSRPAALNPARILVPPHATFTQVGEPFSEILWVSKNKELLALHRKALKSLNVFGCASLVIAGVVAATVIAVSADAKYWTLIGLLVLLGVLFLAIPWVVKPVSRPLLNSRLGSNGESIVVEDCESGKVRQLDIANTLFSNQNLYDGKVYVTWQDFNKVYYDKAEFESLISPLLHKARKVSLFRIYLWRLNSGERSALVGLAVIVASLILLVALQRLT